MFDWLKRLFGEGTIYCEFLCDDGTRGRSKAGFIGDKTTFSLSEYTEQLKREIWIKHQKRITTIQSVRLK